MDNLQPRLDTTSLQESDNCRYALVTVATLGCGKTTTSIILTSLFPDVFGHIQNDNLSSPIGKKLVSGALEILKTKPVTILDRNNPKPKDRHRVFDDFNVLDKSPSQVKFVCLNFVPNRPQKDRVLWRNTRDRVVNRGGNHQSINAEGEQGIRQAEGIMRMFIKDFTPVNVKAGPDSKFDLVINLDARGKNSSLKNAKKVLETMMKFAPELNLHHPTEEQYEEAFKNALAYQPSFSKQKAHREKNPRTPVYFGLEVDQPASLIQKVDKLIASSGKECPVYEKLKRTDRVQKEMHVTLIHMSSRKGRSQKSSLWNKYVRDVFREDLKNIDKMSPKPKQEAVHLPSGVKGDIKLERFCVGQELACIKVSVLGLYTSTGEPIKLGLANKFPHITLGTIDSSIEPVRSNNLLEGIYDFNDSDGIQCFDFEDSDDNVLKKCSVFAWYD